MTINLDWVRSSLKDAILTRQSISGTLHQKRNNLIRLLENSSPNSQGRKALEHEINILTSALNYLTIPAKRLKIYEPFGNGSRVRSQTRPSTNP